MLVKESIFLIISVISGFSFLLLGYYAWRREKSVRAKLFLLVLFFLSINVFSYFFELISESFEVKRLWNNIFYTSLVAYLSLWLLFSLEYRFDRIVMSKNFRKYLLLLCIIPAFTIFLIWFNKNEWFLFFRTTKQVGSFTALKGGQGFFYWIHSCYSWLLVISTTLIILSKIIRLGREYRVQAAAITIGILTPMLYNLVYHILFFVFSLIPPIAFKVTQLMYIVTALTFTWGIFGEKFLDIVPIARRIVFDNVDDLIFVFNSENRIIDANESAHRFMKKGIISSNSSYFEGRSAADVFKGNPKLLETIQAGVEGRNEVVFHKQADNIYFDVSLSAIHDKKNRRIGHAAIFRDITEIRNTQEELIQNIHYASRIQNAILPAYDLFSEFCSDYFILSKPKDIVSGDFCWLTKASGKFIFTVADCTGHGVSGAFMSILGIMFLERIIGENRFVQPGEILNDITSKIKNALRLKDNKKELKDGLELVLCIYDPLKGLIQMAGSLKYIFMARDNSLYRLDTFTEKENFHHVTDSNFDRCELNIRSGDCIYMFTDGYPDQFGGEGRKRFSTKQLQELLNTINNLRMSEQREILDATIKKWQGSSEQTDDITVLGLKF